jgi:hypothetical protein
MAQSADIMNTLTLKGCVEVRKGLEGREAVAAQGRRPCVATEPPESPVFCGAKNAPK